MKNLETLEKILLQTEQLCCLLKDEGYDPSTEFNTDPLSISIDINDTVYLVNYATTIEILQSQGDEDFKLIRTFDKIRNTPRQVIETVLALIK